MAHLQYHIAQINMARLVAPLDDPQLADFVAQLETVNVEADAAPGFVWRLQTDEGNATDVQAFDDPFVLINMSVWESVEALADFTYRSSHVRPLRDRKKWFEEKGRVLALWWIPAGHIPTIEEAKGRIERIRRHGPTPQAFTLAKRFPAPVASHKPVIT